MPARVLVVDDEPSVVTLLKMVFESYGYSVASARSAAEARRRLRKEQFDVVLTDMRMESVTSGFDVCRTARQQPNNPVVIILTAYPVLPDTWREAGADTVVTKPADIAALAKLVEELLVKREQHAR